MSTTRPSGGGGSSMSPPRARSRPFLGYGSWADTGDASPAGAHLIAGGEEPALWHRSVDTECLCRDAYRRDLLAAYRPAGLNHESSAAVKMAISASIESSGRSFVY